MEVLIVRAIRRQWRAFNRARDLEEMIGADPSRVEAARTAENRAIAAVNAIAARCVSPRKGSK